MCGFNTAKYDLYHWYSHCSNWDAKRLILYQLYRYMCRYLCINMYIYIYMCFKYHICIVVFWIYIRISIHIICTWSRSARKKPTALFQSPQETALPFHSALQSGGKIAGFRAGIQCFFKAGMTSLTSYDDIHICDSPNFGRNWLRALKPVLVPNMGILYYLYILHIHVRKRCHLNLHGVGVKRNEPNRTEPLGTLSGHKPRGSCEPCGFFPVPSCNQMFHPQKKHVTGVCRKTPDAGIVFHHCVKDFEALQAGQGDQTFVIDRCIHAWKLLDNIAPPEVPAQPLEPL